MRRADYKANS